MKPIKIATIVSQFPNLVQTYILNVILGLENLGGDVKIVATGKQNNRHIPELVIKHRLLEKTIYINTEIPYLVIGLLTLPILNNTYQRNVTKLAKSNILKKYGLKYFIKTLVRLKSLNDGIFDIAHCHNLTLAYDYLFLKEVFSSSLITTFHGKEPVGSKTLSDDKTETLFKFSDLFLVNTEYAKNILIDTGCPESKIKILPQGTNIEDFPYKKRHINQNEDINLLTVGRLSIEKGQETVIRAMQFLVKSHPNLKYHLVGDGPNKVTLLNLVENLGLQKNIVFHGYVSTRELSDTYNKSHIFILPSIDLKDGSHVETQGVVLQEAQSSGLAVIASRTGGIPNIINDDDTGLLFDEDNITELTDKIRSLINNPKKYSDICFRGKKDVETRFDIGIICGKLLKSYNEQLKLKDPTYSS